jgi:GNAT superfamily N-acetyltransferase
MASLLEADALTPESPSYPSARHLLWTRAGVLEAHRRQGIGRGWLGKVLELADGHGARVIDMRTDQESGHAFLRWLGAEPKFRERESRLDFREVDWDMVSRWIEEGRARSPQTRLELHSGGLPEALFEEVSRALTELNRLVPFEEADHGAFIFTADKTREWYARLRLAHGVHHVYLAREPDGSISGMTDVVKYPHETGFVRQQFTGVRAPAQGRGIGKWLKAAMLAHVREAHPETVYITTENAGSNAPMLAINHQLGFRLHRSVVEYQLGRDALASRV